jgi:hypothetical protein
MPSFKFRGQTGAATFMKLPSRNFREGADQTKESPKLLN